MSNEEPAPKGMQRYRGVLLPSGYRKWQCELHLFGICPPGEKKLRLWKAFVQEVWPDPIFVWDDWAELSFAALCGAKETVERLSGATITADFPWWRCVIFTGAGSTGKSARAALWILGNWLVAQDQTACILTSTSMDLLSKRIWAVLLRWIGLAKVSFPLRSIPSDLELRWNDSDRLHAVFGVAVKSGGNPQEAVDRIKGIHARRTFIVVDEMTAVAQAIVSASRNIRIGTDESQFIGLGNAISKTDPHGERSEPEGGWDSITVDDKFWITKYGCAVHLDAMCSPAMEDPTRFHFYPNKETLAEEAREKGGLNSPDGWSNIRGFWPPTGLTNTVMDEALFDQFSAAREAVWRQGSEMGAAFDPSFEGSDRAILYPFRFGEFAHISNLPDGAISTIPDSMVGGKIGIELMEPIIVAVDMTQDKRWLHYGLADAVQEHCKRLGVEPQNYVGDITGEGGGFHAILSARWSPRINGVEFGGAADKTPVFRDRPATWYETIGNKVSMIWMMFRAYVEGGQVRGLKHLETIKELTSRLRMMKAGKTIVEPKKEMKQRGLRSPDFGDAACLAAFLLYLKGHAPGGATAGGTAMSLDSWNRRADELNAEDDGAYEDAEAAFN